MARVIAALSGGVDSAVAAARAVDAGHEVTAIHLALFRNPATYRTGSRGCCSIEDANDAGRVADQLGIPFYVWDLSQEFHDEVVQNFLDEYQAGRTPNPCLRCNEKIKFASVCNRALSLGFDGVVTGHYAQLKTRDDGIVELHRSEDMAKDQSYVLGVLTQDQLQHCSFPLGQSVKEDVRAEAHARGIRVADKPDSYDICFIPEGDTADYLHDKLGYRPGEILDEQGRVLGNHQGTFTYTIGQRKGLRIGNPSTDGQPRYVLRIDPANDAVIVGPRTHLEVTGIRGIDPLWCEHPPTAPIHGTVQLRAHANEVPAQISVDTDGVIISLESPTYGIACGQTAVIYHHTRVLGSATIDSTW